MKKLLALFFVVASASAEDRRVEVMRQMVERLGSADEGRRRHAAMTLARFEGEAVGLLGGMTDHAQWEARRAAATALAMMETREAQEPLEIFGRDRVWSVREAAAWGLRPGEALEQAARDPVWRVRVAALRRADAHVIRLLLRDSDQDVRRAAELAMLRVEDPAFREEIPGLLAANETVLTGLLLYEKLGGERDLVASLFSNANPAIRARALKAARAAGHDVARDIELYLAEIEAVESLPPDQAAEAMARAEAMTRELEKLGAGGFEAILARLKAGPTERMRGEYAGVLFRSTDASAAPAVRFLLADPDVQRRRDAFATLCRLDPAAACEEAVALLDDPSEDAQVDAVAWLGRTEQGRERLPVVLASKKESLRLAAMRALVRDPSPSCDGPMAEFLDGESAIERELAHRYMLRRGGAAYLDGLEARLNREPVEAIRGYIVHSLAASPVRFKALLARVAETDSSVGVRAMAIHALGRARDTAYSHILLRGLSHREWLIRHHSLEALDFTLPAPDIEPFERALFDASPEIRQVAATALQHRPWPGAFTSLLLAARDPAASVRLAAMDGLAAYPEFFAVSALQDLAATEQDPFVRASIARVSARFPSSIDFLVRRAAAEIVPETRAAFISAIAEAGGERAAAVLRPFAKDNNSAVRVATAMGMGRTPGRADVKLLAELAVDPAPEVRMAAVDAMGQVPGDAATEALWKCVEDADGAVRTLSLAALVRRGDRDAVLEWLDRGGAGADRVELADILFRSGHAEAALDLLCTTQPLSPEALEIAGWCALDLGLFELAMTLFRGSSDKTGGAELAHVLSLAADNRPEAAAVIEAWVARDGAEFAWNASDAAYLLAENLLLPELALSLALRAAAAESHPSVLETLAWTQLRSGRVAESLETFSHIPRLPQPVSFLHLAVARAAAGHHAAAAASLREAFLRQPSLVSNARQNRLLAPLLDREELQPWK